MLHISRKHRLTGLQKRQGCTSCRAGLLVQLSGRATEGGWQVVLGHVSNTLLHGMQVQQLGCYRSAGLSLWVAVSTKRQPKRRMILSLFISL